MLGGFGKHFGSEPLTGNTVVATVNGHSILLDDLVGSMRLNLEASDQVTPEQRQQYLLQAARQKLDGYIDQEIVLDALSKDIDDEKQEIVKQSLEEPFQEVLSKIKGDRGVETNAQLNELLGERRFVDRPVARELRADADGQRLPGNSRQATVPHRSQNNAGTLSGTHRRVYDGRTRSVPGDFDPVPRS